VPRMGSITGVLAASALAASGGSPSASEARAQAHPLDGATITLDPGHNGANGSHPDRINRQVPIGNGET
jgi:N-acetylmuramoyl-L-alanine amidase